MDWQARMKKALDYLEKHLKDEVDIGRAAAEANCSTFHFMRMFEVVTGLGPAEYLRRRRLSMAALDLASGNDTRAADRILDIALDYGYDSPDAFTRAFKREFGCLPSEARIPGTSLHIFPRLSFTVALKGDKAMEYRIEKGPEYRLTGLSIRTCGSDGTGFKVIPGFWTQIMKDGRYEALCGKAAGSRVGICGVCHSCDDKTGDFTYSIAIETPADRSGLPAGCEDILVPASTWAKFTSRGPLSKNFQDVIKRIFSEWFPASGREHAGTPEIEFYPDLPDMEADDYWCEYWVPLK
ncbi:MAG TPA: AraC family transcriptional regulator [Rectinemataceae bacterium]|nr:AraC family transcriptional regulator [Rectinemataceae bacterium]